MLTPAATLTAWDDPVWAKDCCGYIFESGTRERCGDPCMLGSSYCPMHHALTHLAIGSEAEAKKIRSFKAIAKIASNRMGRGSILGPVSGEIEAIESHQLFALANRRAGRLPH